jgi:hypothetical protein
MGDRGGKSSVRWARLRLEHKMRFHQKIQQLMRERWFGPDDSGQLNAYSALSFISGFLCFLTFGLFLLFRRPRVQTLVIGYDASLDRECFMPHNFPALSKPVQPEISTQGGKAGLLSVSSRLQS